MATAQPEISECYHYSDHLRIDPPYRLTQDELDKVNASSGETIIDFPDGYRLFRHDGSNLTDEYPVLAGKMVLVLRKA